LPAGSQWKRAAVLQAKDEEERMKRAARWMIIGALFAIKLWVEFNIFRYLTLAQNLQIINNNHEYMTFVCNFPIDSPPFYAPQQEDQTRRDYEHSSRPIALFESLENLWKTHQIIPIIIIPSL